ncbi:MAG: recombinase family protein [Candidatus Sedimenticola sp. (ex Thyasira tokunagai)]
MYVGYSRISKSDGSQSLDMQMDLLLKAGVNKGNIYTDSVSGVHKDRPELISCLKSLRAGDTLLVYKLDRLGRNLGHLVSIIEDLNNREVGFRVLSGHGATINTTTSAGKFIFGVFAALAEFERDLIRERTISGLKAARSRGKIGGRKHKLTKGQVRLAQASMKEPDTNVSELCRELKISRQTLYRYVSPEGELRIEGKKVLCKK